MSLDGLPTVLSQHVSVTVDTARQALHGWTELAVLVPPSAEVLCLHAFDLEVSSVLIDGHEAEFEVAPGPCGRDLEEEEQAALVGWQGAEPGRAAVGGESDGAAAHPGSFPPCSLAAAPAPAGPSSAPAASALGAAPRTPAPHIGDPIERALEPLLADDPPSTLLDDPVRALSSRPGEGGSEDDSDLDLDLDGGGAGAGGAGAGDDSDPEWEFDEGAAGGRSRRGAGGRGSGRGVIRDGSDWDARLRAGLARAAERRAEHDALPELLVRLPPPEEPAATDAAADGDAGTGNGIGAGVSGTAANASAADPQQPAGRPRIRLVVAGAKVPPPTLRAVAVRFSSRNPRAGVRFRGGFALTTGEPRRASAWFPCVDLPDAAVTLGATLHVTARAHELVAASGRLVAVLPSLDPAIGAPARAGWKTFQYSVDVPSAPWQLGWVVGPFQAAPVELPTAPADPVLALPGTSAPKPTATPAGTAGAGGGGESRAGVGPQAAQGPHAAADLAPGAPGTRGDAAGASAAAGSPIDLSPDASPPLGGSLLRPCATLLAPPRRATTPPLGPVDASTAPPHRAVAATADYVSYLLASFRETLDAPMPLSGLQFALVPDDLLPGGLACSGGGSGGVSASPAAAVPSWAAPGRSRGCAPPAEPSVPSLVDALPPAPLPSSGLAALPCSAAVDPACAHAARAARRALAAAAAAQWFGGFFVPATPADEWLVVGLCAWLAQTALARHEGKAEAAVGRAALARSVAADDDGDAPPLASGDREDMGADAAAAREAGAAAAAAAAAAAIAGGLGATGAPGTAAAAAAALAALGGDAGALPPSHSSAIDAALSRLLRPAPAVATPWGCPRDASALDPTRLFQRKALAVVLLLERRGGEDLFRKHVQNVVASALAAHAAEMRGAARLAAALDEAVPGGLGGAGLASLACASGGALGGGAAGPGAGLGAALAEAVRPASGVAPPAPAGAPGASAPAAWSRRLSAATFLVELGKLGGFRKEVAAFDDRWVRGAGCPRLHAAYAFHAVAMKKCVLELAVRQTGSRAARLAAETASARAAAEGAGVDVLKVAVRESDGVAEHAMHVGAAPARLVELRVNPEVKRPGGTRRGSRRGGAAGGGGGGGGTGASGRGGRRGGANAAEDDDPTYEVAGLEGQTTSGAGQPGDDACPLQWVRVDPSGEWLADVHVSQPAKAWIAQLTKSRDAVAQVDALRALGGLGLAGPLVAALRDVSLGAAVRAEAAAALARVSDADGGPAGLNALIEIFRSRFWDDALDRPCADALAAGERAVEAPESGAAGAQAAVAGACAGADAGGPGAAPGGGAQAAAARAAIAQMKGSSAAAAAAAAVAAAAAAKGGAGGDASGSAAAAKAAAAAASRLPGGLKALSPAELFVAEAEVRAIGAAREADGTSPVDALLFLFQALERWSAPPGAEGWAGEAGEDERREDGNGHPSLIATAAARSAAASLPPPADSSGVLAALCTAVGGARSELFAEAAEALLERRLRLELALPSPACAVGAACIGGLASLIPTLESQAAAEMAEYGVEAYGISASSRGDGMAIDRYGSGYHYDGYTSDPLPTPSSLEAARSARECLRAVSSGRARAPASLRRAAAAAELALAVAAEGARDAVPRWLLVRRAELQRLGDLSSALDAALTLLRAAARFDGGDGGRGRRGSRAKPDSARETARRARVLALARWAELEPSPALARRVEAVARVAAAGAAWAAPMRDTARAAARASTRRAARAARRGAVSGRVTLRLPTASAALSGGAAHSTRSDDVASSAPVVRLRVASQAPVPAESQQGPSSSQPGAAADIESVPSRPIVRLSFKPPGG